MFYLEAGKYLNASFFNSDLKISGTIEAVPQDQQTSSGVNSMFDIRINIVRDARKSSKSIAMTLMYSSTEHTDESNTLEQTSSRTVHEVFGDIGVILDLTISKISNNDVKSTPMYSVAINTSVTPGTRVFSYNERTQLERICRNIDEFLHSTNYSSTAEQFTEDCVDVCSALTSVSNMIRSKVIEVNHDDDMETYSHWLHN